MFEEKHPELISLRSPGSPSNFVQSLNAVAYADNAVVVYPNPADQSVTVKMVNSGTIINKIQIISSMGKVVTTYIPDNSTYLLNLKGIVPGLYFLKFIVLIKSTTRKFRSLDK